MDKRLHKLTGISKILEVYDNKVIIRQVGLLNKLAQGFKGDKTIYIKNMSAIQIKAPGLLTNGYIQFTLSGGNEFSGGMRAATQDENSLFFAKDKCEIVQRIENTLDRLMSEQNKAQVVAHTLSEADELEKFKKLVDNKVITQEEFEAKKKSLLGL